VDKAVGARGSAPGTPVTFRPPKYRARGSASILPLPSTHRSTGRAAARPYGFFLRAGCAARIASVKSFDGVEPGEILEIVHKYETLDQTRAMARDYAGRARAALTPFANSPARETLETALDFVMERDR